MRGEDPDEQNKKITPLKVRNQGQRSITQSGKQSSIEIDTKQKNFITVENNVYRG